MKQMKKPPLGLKPKFLHDEKRAGEIVAALGRYVAAKAVIPVEWIEELNNLWRENK